MVEAWQPATELEGRMRDALDTGDQESYFELLAQIELIIPVPPDLAEEVLVGQAQPIWPTQEVAGRTHVQTFTSPEAMRACIGSEVQHFVRLKFSDLAEGWPQPQWWLAVNLGLPIQSLLPSWFVKQMTYGDVRPPQAGSTISFLSREGIAGGPQPATQSTQPATTQPATTQPATTQPATAQPATAQPATTQPATTQPVAAQPATTQPAATRPADDFQPAGDVERELLRADMDGDENAFMETLIGAEVLIPVPEDADPTLCPGRPGFPWQTTQVDDQTAIALFTSPDRMHEVLGEPAGSDFVKFPFGSVIRYWPDRTWALAVNPGTKISVFLAGERLLSLAEQSDQRAAQRMAEHFEPQNDVEKSLFEANTSRDIEAFFTILRSSRVLIPADPEASWGSQPSDPDFPWRPVPVKGENSIQMFTSLKWMHEAIGPSGYIMPSFLDIVSAWPDPQWTLVLNPGTAIDAAVPGDQIGTLKPEPERQPETQREPAAQPEPKREPAAQAEPKREPETEAEPEPEPKRQPEREPEAEPGPQQEVGPEPVPEPVPEFEPGNRLDQELYEAAVSGDTDAFLRVLLVATVLLPIPADAPLELTPTDPRFQWEAALRDPGSVQVFTSLTRLREGLGEAAGSVPAGPTPRFVYADFRDLIGYWPNAEWAMLLNPGTRIGASLRGDQVQALSEWAVRVGLIRRVETTSPQAWQAKSPQEQPSQASAKPFAATPSKPAHRPSVMQKVLPHGHVGWYLDQDYDRIGGFVHLAADVADLHTPAQLYEVLGLLYAGSEFSLDDEGVYVIRWAAHCRDLYRIPFGGQTEEELRRWGDAGWVVEQPPFYGDGFAPGGAGTIREYKVDSVRLPYGAEMYYLGRDHSQRFVAVYDPDLLTWLRPENSPQPGSEAVR